MRHFFAYVVTCVIVLLAGCSRKSLPQEPKDNNPIGIIAHRGIWEGTAQNSIESLKLAQSFGCWGSEFDVQLTLDNELVVFHGKKIGDLLIQNSTLAEIRSYKLKNGEYVPTLEEYLIQGEQSENCVLVLEIKRNDEKGREIIVINKCISLLLKHNLLYPERVVFISSSYDVCKELVNKCPDFSIQYLNGDKAPAVLMNDGINGIDYHYSKYYANPQWIEEAHELGMIVNVWTVDKEEDIRRLIDLGVDQITTNTPALVKAILADQAYEYSSL